MTAVALTVLVVDDEEDLREAIRRMLERRGFATLTAADPAEAEAVCREYASLESRAGEHLAAARCRED